MGDTGSGCELLALQEIEQPRNGLDRCVIISSVSYAPSLFPGTSLLFGVDLFLFTIQFTAIEGNRKTNQDEVADLSIRHINRGVFPCLRGSHHFERNIIHDCVLLARQEQQTKLAVFFSQHLHHRNLNPATLPGIPSREKLPA